MILDMMLHIAADTAAAADAALTITEPESTSKTQVVEQRKRSYSAGLYTYTKLKWDDFRQDVE
jgi:hypothetical protein